MKLKLLIIVFLLSWLISAVVNLSLTYYKLAQSQKETQKQLALQKQNKEKIENMTVEEILTEIPPKYGVNPEVVTAIASNATGLVALAASLAFGLSAIAAGMAEKSIGMAAVGAIAEKEDLFGKGLILTVLPETIVIFGLVVAILILGKI